jgi:hypothetical protein
VESNPSLVARRGSFPAFAALLTAASRVIVRKIFIMNCLIYRFLAGVKNYSYTINSEINCAVPKNGVLNFFSNYWQKDLRDLNGLKGPGHGIEKQLL